MKTKILSISLALFCLSGLNEMKGQTFANGCLNSDLLVTFYFSPSPCTGPSSSYTMFVPHQSSHNFGPPPAGTFYYKCEATIWPIPNPCGGASSGTVMWDLGGLGGCNGPEYVAFGCPANFSSVDMWINSSAPGLHVECDGN